MPEDEPRQMEPPDTGIIPPTSTATLHSFSIKGFSFINPPPMFRDIPDRSGQSGLPPLERQGQKTACAEPSMRKASTTEPVQAHTSHNFAMGCEGNSPMATKGLFDALLERTRDGLAVTRASRTTTQHPTAATNVARHSHTGGDAPLEGRDARFATGDTERNPAPGIGYQARLGGDDAWIQEPPRTPRRRRIAPPPGLESPRFDYDAYDTPSPQNNWEPGSR